MEKAIAMELDDIRLPDPTPYEETLEKLVALLSLSLDAIRPGTKAHGIKLEKN